MKKIVLLASILVSSLLISNYSSAQRFYVRVRPVAPVVIRPVAPRPTAIWIEPEWVWRGGRYVYVNGYWTEPRVGYRYMPGYWRRTRHGELWVAGVWVR
ncbi:hypothetical protein ACFOW1_05875 [Parasediminibacterium paludis]|uniref:YXWGXW repeat-containing protein n=1 Tax=Parasediminibacterium paludis TaxID=908966 RepID=A0ABV8PV02_9BACT